MHINTLRSPRKPQPYTAGLRPLASDLRPLVTAKKCLQQWCPLATRSAGKLTPTTADIQRITDVLSHTWSDGTLGTYRTATHTASPSERLPPLLS